MNTEPATPPPRRKWHLQRWLILLAAGLLAYAGWTTYSFRAALKEAKALGWEVDYTDPVEMIGADWRYALSRETWRRGMGAVIISKGGQFEQHIDIVHRLNPTELQIHKAATLLDLSALKSLTRLQWVCLYGCTGLTNVDALKNHFTLQVVSFTDCTALTNVDALKSLPALQEVWLEDCTGLTKETIVALRAALPNTKIIAP